MSGYAIEYWPDTSHIKTYRGVNDQGDLLDGEVYSETEPDMPVPDPKSENLSDPI